MTTLPSKSSNCSSVNCAGVRGGIIIVRLPNLSSKAGSAHVGGQFELKESQHLEFREAVVDCSWTYGVLIQRSSTPRAGRLRYVFVGPLLV